MLLRLFTYLVLAAVLYWGLRSIWKDWRKKFASDDQQAQIRRQERLERNKQEAKGSGVVELEQGEDGVYRPRRKPGSDEDKS